MGIGQIAHQLASENEAYRHMLERARASGETRLVRQMESAAPSMTVPLPPAYMRIRDRAMHRLGGGTTRAMRSVIPGVFLASWRSPDYTLREKIGIWRGKALSDALLWNTILATDLTESIRDVEVPVYFLHGLHDYTVTRAGTRAFFDALDAPVKGFYTFPRSAHSPMFEEPERLRRILEHDVLLGERALADPS